MRTFKNCGGEFDDSTKQCWQYGQTLSFSHDQPKTKEKAPPISSDKQVLLKSKRIAGKSGKSGMICPKCKATHDSVWIECTECKSSLISRRKFFYVGIFKKICIFILILYGLYLSTYHVQVSERKYYNRSVDYLRVMEFKASGQAFWKAFSASPVFEFISASMKKTKNVIEKAGKKVVVGIEGLWGS